MIDKIGTNNQPLIESGSSTGQPNPPGALRGNDVDVSIQVNYASLVDKAMQPPKTDTISSCRRESFYCPASLIARI